MCVCERERRSRGGRQQGEMRVHLFGFLDTFREATPLNNVEKILRRLHLQTLHFHRIHSFHGG